MSNYGYIGGPQYEEQPIEFDLRLIFNPKVSILPSDVLAAARQQVRVDGKCGDPSPNEPLPDFYEDTAAALKYCRDCPAKRACLVLSFDDRGRGPKSYGVWAGLKAGARDAIYSAFRNDKDWEALAEKAWAGVIVREPKHQVPPPRLPFSETVRPELDDADRGAIKRLRKAGRLSQVRSVSWRRNCYLAWRIGGIEWLDTNSLASPTIRAWVEGKDPWPIDDEPLTERKEVA